MEGDSAPVRPRARNRPLHHPEPFARDRSPGPITRPELITALITAPITEPITEPITQNDFSSARANRP
jgi:hypothetical protein